MTEAQASVSAGSLGSPCSWWLHECKQISQQPRACFAVERKLSIDRNAWQERIASIFMPDAAHQPFIG